VKIAAHWLPLVRRSPNTRTIDQGAAFALAIEPLIDGIVVAPRHVSQSTGRHTQFDVVATHSQGALHVKTADPARHGTRVMDWAGTGRAVD